MSYAQAVQSLRLAAHLIILRKMPGLVSRIYSVQVMGRLDNSANGWPTHVKLVLPGLVMVAWVSKRFVLLVGRQGFEPWTS